MQVIQPYYNSEQINMSTGCQSNLHKNTLEKHTSYYFITKNVFEIPNKIKYCFAGEKLNGFHPHCHCRYLHQTAAFAVKKKPRKAFECFSGLLPIVF